MACDCIVTVDKMLADKNTRLFRPITFSGLLDPAEPVRLMVVTEQIKRGRGKKQAVSMLATFCPFCGVEYINLPATPKEPA